jgi:hypothetical protein
MQHFGAAGPARWQPTAGAELGVQLCQWWVAAGWAQGWAWEQGECRAAFQKVLGCGSGKWEWRKSISDLLMMMA